MVGLVQSKDGWYVKLVTAARHVGRAVGVQPRRDCWSSILPDARSHE